MATMNGAAYAVFSVRLTEASTSEIRVDWHTEDGTGHAGTDYKASSGTVTFPPGTLEQTLQVEVYGRSPQDSTDDRTFLIRLNPPVGAILENATAECVLSVVTVDGSVFTQVYLPAGPRGRPGNPGLVGLNTYELAKLNGFAGTLTQWLATVTGRNVELINDGTWIKWRPQNTENPQQWQNLIELATLRGLPGSDGREVQFQKSSTAIQWRYTGQTAWTDLVQLADLKADPQPLKNRSNWVTGTTYNPGDYVAATATASSSKSLYFLIDAVPYVSSIEPKSDLTHWLELSPPQGAKGDDGREVEFQKTATAVQWRYVDDTDWTTLFLLADVQGSPGKNPQLQLNSAQNAVQWRLEGDTDWQTLFALSLIQGANGKNIELQKGATYIQWRVVGDTAWQNLIAIADISGANGSNGSTWYSGTGAPATSSGVVNDFYLRNDTGGIYKKTGAAVWTLQMTITVTGGGTTWLIVTDDPAAGTGADGNMALNTANGKILLKTSGAWSTLITIPLEATTDEAQAAAITGKFTSPARVREYLEGLGLGASFMNLATDLNSVLKNVPFVFGQDTLHIPATGAWGRGFTVASDQDNLTQFAIINSTGQVWMRFKTAGTWGNWSQLPSGKPVLCMYNNPGGASYSATTWNILKLYTKVDDDHAAYSSTTGLFTVPETGNYRITATVQGATAANTIYLALAINGAADTGLLYIGGCAAVTSRPSVVHAGDVLRLNAGDTVGLKVYPVTASVMGRATLNIEKISS